LGFFGLMSFTVYLGQVWVAVTVRLSLGFSPCPNDTLIFYALTQNKIKRAPFVFEEFIEDVQTLNEKALRKELHITKVSVATYLKVKDDYELLSSGGAIGRGCGPLLVTERIDNIKELNGAEIAIPGRLTTAYLLFLFYIKRTMKDFSFKPIFMTFDKIIPAIKKGNLRAGLIIHESRFTYESQGLKALVDLGKWWESETGLPVPLGAIIAKKDLGEEIIKKIDSFIRESVIYGLNHLEEALPYIRSYSQELSEDVIIKHIRLYVNDFTINMSDEGRRAIETLGGIEI